MKKIMTCFLSMILCFTFLYTPNNTVEAYTADSIENNTIQFLAYEYPLDIKKKVVELKFIDQGNGTAKLKCYSNGKFINANEIQSNLALYCDLYIHFTNIYGYRGGSYLDRGTSMRSIAQMLESLTFTYGVDAFTIAKRPTVNPIHFEYEGKFMFGYGGKIQGNLNNRDFNEAFMYQKNTTEWRFRVRKNGLHAEYLNQTKLEDGEYYIETDECSNRVLDILSGNNVGTNDYRPNATSQKVILDFDEVNFGTTIRFAGTNKYLTWNKNNGNNVIASEKMTSGDIGEQYWYFVENGNGTYKIVSARQDTRFLNLDSNNTNISISDNKNNAKKQTFKLVKANERKSIFNSNVKIVSKLNNNKVLNIHLGGTDGKDLTIWDDAGVSQQRFKFEYDQSKNAYRIRDCYYNGYLAWNSNGKSSLVSTYKGCYDSSYWTLEYAGDGYYYIKNLYNKNMVLDVYQSCTNNGTNVQVYAKDNANNKKFKFVY